ncbi:hypothetical protein HDV05_005652 [Chytridiales sp. JEL 0842]|nr:hypothetical protein HDV05_005652 [Chytridiales sp. JEL 0842]
MFPALTESPDGTSKIIGNVLSKLEEFASGCYDMCSSYGVTRDEIQRLQAEYRSLLECYMALDFFMKNLFTTSTDNPGTIQALKDINRYIWLFFLFWRDQLRTLAETYDESMSQYLIAYSAIFVGTQVESNLRCKVSLSDSTGAVRHYDWSEDMAHAKRVVCQTRGLDESLYLQMEVDTLCKVLKTLCDNDLFRYNDVSPSHVAWPIYHGAFNISSSNGKPGLLPANIDLLNKQLSKQIHIKNWEIDYRTFLPSWRIIATPRRIARSVIPSKSVARNLKPIFAKTSAFTNLMPATPISARQLAGRGHTQADEKMSLQSKLEGIHKLMGGAAWEAEAVHKIFPTLQRPDAQKIIQRVQFFHEFIRKNTPGEIWPLEIMTSVYLRLLDDLLPPKKYEYYATANYIAAFYYALSKSYGLRIVISFETALKALETQSIQLCIVVELVQNSALWTTSLLKRFKEIDERLLESEVWIDGTIYNAMDTAVAMSSGNNECLLSEILKLYGELNESSTQTVSMASNDWLKGLKTFCSIVLSDPRETGDIVTFYNKVFLPKLRGILKEDDIRKIIGTGTSVTPAAPAAEQFFSPLRLLKQSGKNVMQSVARKGPMSGHLMTPLASYADSPAGRVARNMGNTDRGLRETAASRKLFPSGFEGGAVQGWDEILKAVATFGAIEGNPTDLIFPASGQLTCWENYSPLVPMEFVRQVSDANLIVEDPTNPISVWQAALE